MSVTRIAPSPTGFMHVGTARTALFNWLAARATGGRFILRLDDTDADRNVGAAVQPILDGLKWLGLDWDDYVRQSDRSAAYGDHARLLLDAGLATSADNGAVLLAAGAPPRTWDDAIGGTMRIPDDLAKQVDGLVLIRGGDRAGQATYNFASILDDYLLGVDFVIRGVDHIANTGKQIGIWSALAQVLPPRDPPRFAHVGLIFKDGKKMAKRDGAASLLDYRDAGTDPDAMFNFLLRMGWGPSVDDKSATFIDRDRAIAMFLTGGKMRAANAGFDAAKLAFYDRNYKRLKATALPSLSA
jgi:nondiscriminating glutamyl-tRNA synthetase